LRLSSQLVERMGGARTVHAQVPPRVEYELTELGQGLPDAVIELGNWAAAHTPAIAEARKRVAATM
jgi:DNA-binding HxlR family transcriptional regulator